MVKLIYVAEDDDYLGLQTSDVFWAEPLENGDGYIYTDKFGTKLFVENWEVEEIVESPVEWCRRMQDEVETGEEAWNYYKLAQMWMGREKEDEHSGV